METKKGGMMKGAGGGAMLSLHKLEQAVIGLPVDDLPEVIGDLARLQAMAQVRLYGQVGSASPSSSEDEVLTVKQVAKILKRSSDYVYRSCQCKDGIPHGRDGTRLFFKRSKVNQWVEEKFRRGEEHANLSAS
jgi:excisionase family DNA binding protein